MGLPAVSVSELCPHKTAVKYATSNIWPQGIGGEMNLSTMAMFEVWTRGIKPTIGQL